jgi:hypothetical protein
MNTLCRKGGVLLNKKYVTYLGWQAAGIYPLRDLNRDKGKKGGIVNLIYFPFFNKI